MIVSDDDVEAALAVLSDETGAAERASHEYLDSLTKSVLAELIAESNEPSVVAKEHWARAQPKYKEHLVRVGEFAKRDYMARQRYMAADAKIRLYQTASANQRGMERLR